MPMTGIICPTRSYWQDRVSDAGMRHDREGSGGSSPRPRIAVDWPCQPASIVGTERASMTRALWLRIGVVLLASTAALGQVDNPSYTQVGRLPRVVASESLVNFLFDPVGRRLYAQSRGGVYWVDVREREPRLNGPILPRSTGAIEIAPDLGRLYFADKDEFGYLNLRSNEPPKTLVRQEWQGGG